MPSESVGGGGVLGASAPASVNPGAGRAIVKEKRSWSDPGAPEAAPAAVERSFAVTETRSPAAKGRSGANCEPALSGCALRRPR